MRIAVPSRSAYELWLSRNLKHARLVMAEGFEATINVFLKDQLEALAGLRVALTEDAKKSLVHDCYKKTLQPSSKPSAHAMPIPKG